MAIAFSNLGASVDTATNPDLISTADATSYTNSSWTPPTADLICCIVATEVPSGTPNTVTMSGNSLTWTSIVTTTSSLYRLTLFGANGSGSSTGTTTVTAGSSQTQTQCMMSFFAATGVDLTGGVTAAFVQQPTAFSFGSTSGSVTLSAASHADNRPLSGWFLITNLGMTPEWTEADELIGAASRLETQYNTSAFDTSATVTWGGTSQVWFGLAAEVKATVAAATTRRLQTTVSPRRW